MRTPALFIAAAAAAVLFSGCSSTQKRAAVVGTASAVGAGIGYVAGDEKPGAAAAGAVVGALGAALLQGEDKETYQRGVDDGYVQGSSDAVKRLYWAKQALEKRGTDETDGITRYYVWEEEGTTPDGRKLAPEKVAVAVYEPQPVKK